MGKFLCLRYFHNLDPLASGRLDDALYFHIALKSLFRSTSLREARPILYHAPIIGIIIQIHQPQGGQTQHITTYCLALVIQIHQPQGGQTFILTNIHFLNINLDPLASGRLDPLRSVRWHQKAIQIHQPQGGQTCTASFTGFSKKFRSTSLREARRVLYKRLRYHRIIQIHQPQGGQT